MVESNSKSVGFAHKLPGVMCIYQMEVEGMKGGGRSDANPQAVGRLQR
jgi:hypothetical protein